MRRPVIRLAGLATVLGLLALAGLLWLPVSSSGVQAAVEPFGVFAPLAFVLAAAVLALSFVPGPLLSAASGVLFGTWLGFGCSVASSSLTAVLALLLARRAGAGAVAELSELSGPRALALVELARRRGFAVVVLQRLIPGVPDAPLSYAFGLIGLRLWQVAAGTIIGSAPLAFSYTALVVGVGVSLVGASSVGCWSGPEPQVHDHGKRGSRDADGARAVTVTALTPTIPSLDETLGRNLYPSGP